MLGVLIKLTLLSIAHLKPTKLQNFLLNLIECFHRVKRLENIVILVETITQHQILIIYYLMSTATPQIFEITLAICLP